MPIKKQGSHSNGQSHASRPNNPNPAAKPNKNKILIIAAAAVCVVLVGVFLFLTLGNKTSSKQDEFASGDSLGVQYFYIVGDDSWCGSQGTNAQGNADLNILLRVDFDSGVIHMVSIPRDTEVESTKLNFYYCDNGMDKTIAQVRNITGVDVQNYITINFEGLQTIVDSFGGISIDLPYSGTYTFYSGGYSAEKITAGEQTIDGWKAMVNSRARTLFESYGLNQDQIRQVVDRRMLASLIKSAFSNPATAASTISTLAGNIKTNLSAATILKMAEKLASLDKLTIYGTTGPTDGAIQSDGLWKIPYSKDLWSKLMQVVVAGNDPKDVVAQYDAFKDSNKAPIYQKWEISLKD